MVFHKITNNVTLAFFLNKTFSILGTILNVNHMVKQLEKSSVKPAGQAPAKATTSGTSKIQSGNLFCFCWKNTNFNVSKHFEGEVCSCCNFYVFS